MHHAVHRNGEQMDTTFIAGSCQYFPLGVLWMQTAILKGSTNATHKWNEEPGRFTSGQRKWKTTSP